MKKRTINLGLRGKLTFIIILAVVVAVGAVGFISILSMRTELENQIKQSQMLLAKSFSEEVQQFFDDAMGMVRTASHLPAVRDVSSIDQIREDIKGVPRDVDVPKREAMNNIIDHYGDFMYMEQVTSDVGNNIVLEPWEYQLDLQRLDFGMRDWFQSALSKMDAHVSEVYISSSLNAPVIAVAHPVLDDGGRPTAVLMGAMTLDRLNDLCKQLTFGQTGHAYLVDHQGNLAAHADSNYTKDVMNVLEIPMVERAMAGETGVGEFYDTLEQSEVLASYMPIGSTGWSIVVSQDPDEAFAPISATLTRVILTTGILLLVAVLLAFVIANSISRPITRMASEVEKVAQGDLTASIDVRTRDEIGVLARGLNTAVKNTNDVLTDINMAADQVASGSKQVSDSSMALSQGAAEQASSIEQLTASLEEISSQTQVNAGNANEANELAEKAREEATKGNVKMQEMLTAMEEINESSGNISKIIKVIDEIAFQTNILALNAAVEAARAGQHGKGFAVVAEEVRNLAARSANAARETTEMIEGSIKKTEGGTQIANETAQALQKIVEDVARAVDLVGNIAAASNEQASAIAQVNQAVAQVSDVVQTNSATSEESAAASEELSSQAELLKEMVARFNLKQTTSFQTQEEISPEILKMLGEMSGEKKGKAKGTKEISEGDVKRGDISLSDSEFGKY